MNKITDYDTYDYDYSTYWKKREYEHKSEILVLDKLIKNYNGKWFLDIGGSFGRLSCVYSEKYSNPIIIDYSLKTLQKNYTDLIKRFPNIKLIAANAYFLPFKSNTFDGSLMVRVLHHIDRPKDCLKEIYRVLSPDGMYIQEYANKVHIKATIRALLKFDFSFFKKEPYQQPDKHNYEGAREDSKVLFINYHSAWISKLFSDIGLNIKKKYGCSFFRINILKRVFSTKFLLFFENLSQNLLSWSNISPSIFVQADVNKNLGDRDESNTLEDILVCPKCKSKLIINDLKAKCSQCDGEFFKKQNIWDFRI